MVYRLLLLFIFLNFINVVSAQDSNAPQAVHHINIQPINNSITAAPPIINTDSIKKARRMDSLSNWRLKTISAATDQYDSYDKAFNIQSTLINKNPTWLFYTFLLLAALITFIRVQYNKEFSEIFSVFKMNSITQQLYRENTATGVRIGYFLLNLNFVVTFSIWIFLILKRTAYVIFLDDYLLIITIAFSILILMLARNVLLQLVSWVLTSNKEINFFSFTELQIFRATGLILFPCCILISYSPEPFGKIFYILSFVLLATFFLFRYLRGFEIGREYFFRNLFHFLIYICTLEIAPALIIVRFLGNITHQ